MLRMRKIGINTKFLNELVTDSYAAGVEKAGFIPILPKRNILSKFKADAISTAISQNEINQQSLMATQK